MGREESLGSTLSLHEGAAGSGEKRGPRRLVLALEAARPLAAPVLHSLSGVDEVVIGRGRGRRYERVRAGGVRRLVVEVPDAAMSASHARIVKVRDAWVLEDSGSKNGVLVNGVARSRCVLADDDVLELGRTFFVYADKGPPLEGAASDMEVAPSSSASLETLIPALAASFRDLARAAPSDVSVVIRGESGTGKEVIAKAVHDLSGRRGRFVAVNCGALPSTLVEASLFGHRRGAFSGAVEDRPGFVRSADGGTLFLDEVAELPQPAQVALLRVLQEREVVPVGETKPIPVDIRLLAATHRDLDALQSSGGFRADFGARLSGLTIQLPPLRERRQDLGLLVAALLRKLTAEADQVTFTGPAARALFLYGWPLNVRELEKSLGVARVLADGAPVGLEHLPAPVREAATPREPTPPMPPADAAPRAAASQAATPTPGPDSPARSSAESEERERIVFALERCAGNQTRAASLLGISRRTLVERLRLYAIPRPLKKENEPR